MSYSGIIRVDRYDDRGYENKLHYINVHLILVADNIELLQYYFTEAQYLTNYEINFARNII